MTDVFTLPLVIQRHKLCKFVFKWRVSVRSGALIYSTVLPHHQGMDITDTNLVTGRQHHINKRIFGFFFYSERYKSLLESISTLGAREKKYCHFYIIQSMSRVITEWYNALSLSFASATAILTHWVWGFEKCKPTHSKWTMLKQHPITIRG